MNQSIPSADGGLSLFCVAWLCAQQPTCLVLSTQSSWPFASRGGGLLTRTRGLTQERARALCLRVDRCQRWLAHVCTRGTSRKHYRIICAVAYLRYHFHHTLRDAFTRLFLHLLLVFSYVSLVLASFFSLAFCFVDRSRSSEVTPTISQ